MKIWLLFLLCCTYLNAEVQVDRFDFHLKALKKQLAVIEKYKHAKDKEEIQKLDDAIRAVRTPAFSLEVLLGFYQDHYSELEGLKDLVKILEDNTGKNIDRLEHIARLSKHAEGKKDKKYLSKTITYMKARQDEGRSHIIKLLEDAKWLKSPLLKIEIEQDELKHPGELAFDRIKRKLDKVEWDSKKDDRDFLAEEAIEYVEKHLIKGSLYDLTDLNGPMGLHKRRRMDRRLSILMSATNGLFVLTNEGTPNAYQELLSEPIAQGKFSKLPEASSGKRHIFFPRGIFLEMNKMIEEFGKAKDFGEAMHEWLPEMLLGSGEAPTVERANVMADEIVSSWEGFEDPVKIAKRAYKRLLGLRPGTRRDEHTVYHALTSALKEQIGMTKKEDCRRLAKAMAR